MVEGRNLVIVERHAGDEQAAKLEFVVDRATARALGLTIPQSVRLRADEAMQ